jgi:hypothetical protein
MKTINKTIYEKLPEIVDIKGTGIPKLTAKRILRKGKKAIYERSDGMYECFYVKTQEACKIFDNEYPAKETYPSNEDFGKIAWCFNDLQPAMDKYKKL